MRKPKITHKHKTHTTQHTHTKHTPHTHTHTHTHTQHVWHNIWTKTSFSGGPPDGGAPRTRIKFETLKPALISDKTRKQRLSIRCVFQNEALHLNKSQQYGRRQHISNTQHHEVSTCYRSACYGVPLPVQTVICDLNLRQSNRNATIRAEY